MFRKNRKLIIAWLAVILWMILIFTLSAQPTEQTNKLSIGLTKRIMSTEGAIDIDHMDSTNVREIIHISADYKFMTLDVESLRRHYARTLLCWYDNYEDAIDQVNTMFGEKFTRMWALYNNTVSKGLAIDEICRLIFEKRAIK